jgi:hypothetical protein
MCFLILSRELLKNGPAWMFLTDVAQAGVGAP